jgi:hypothetical protein
MPARSVVIQLQPGVQQAILPDHRKMLPGIQYVIDWDTFDKLSLGARQNVIQVVTVNGDTTTASGSYVLAQSSTGVNQQLSLSTVLTTVGTTPTSYTLAGFASQGYDAGGTAGTNTGVGPVFTGAAANQALTGPAGERYIYVYNANATITSGQVTVWSDEVARFVTNARPTYQVFVDGQGTQYQASTNDTNVTPTVVGTKQGRFAGTALVTIPSGNYGWIQCAGLAPYVAASGIITAGSTVSVSAATGFAQAQAGGSTVVNGVTVSGSALSNNVFGTALTALASGTGFIQVDIRSVSKAKKPYNRFLNKN